MFPELAKDLDDNGVTAENDGFMREHVYGDEALHAKVALLRELR